MSVGQSGLLCAKVSHWGRLIGTREEFDMELNLLPYIIQQK